MITIKEYPNGEAWMECEARYYADVAYSESRLANWYPSIEPNLSILRTPKMKVTRDKNTYCHTCKKAFHYLGINRHRAMHRDKKEYCKITYTQGDTYEFAFDTLRRKDDSKK